MNDMDGEQPDDCEVAKLLPQETMMVGAGRWRRGPELILRD